MKETIELSNQQKNVVNTINGQLLVVACPGSGKTRTMICRVHEMVTKYNIAPESILVLTFSNDAADDMKEKYREFYLKPSEDIRNCKINFSTIHSFCKKIISIYDDVHKDYDILTDVDKTLNDIVFKKEPYKSFLEFQNNNTFVRDFILEMSNMRKFCKDINSYEPQICEKSMYLMIINEYDTYKEINKLYDFDDMLIFAKNIIYTNQSILNDLRNKYKYICVDEFQDIDPIQRDIIYMIAGANGNLAVVGDDDQSIYGFRRC